MSDSDGSADLVKADQETDARVGEGQGQAICTSKTISKVIYKVFRNAIKVISKFIRKVIIKVISKVTKFIVKVFVKVISIAASSFHTCQLADVFFG